MSCGCPQGFPSEPVPAMLTFSDLYPMLLNMGIIADVVIIEEKRMSGPLMEPAKIIPLLSYLLCIRDKPADMQRLKEILEGMRSRMSFRKPSGWSTCMETMHRLFVHFSME